MKAVFTTRNEGHNFLDRVCNKLGEKFKPHEITIESKKSTRSLEQNAYLWGVCYQTILDAGQLEGWRKEDLHEYFLGEHFGWEHLEGFGRKRLRPVNRSSTLSKMQFVDFVDFIHQKMAEIGIVIPDPK